MTVALGPALSAGGRVFRAIEETQIRVRAGPFGTYCHVSKTPRGILVGEGEAARAFDLDGTPRSLAALGLGPDAAPED